MIRPHECPHRPSKLTVRRMVIPPATRFHTAIAEPRLEPASLVLPTLPSRSVAIDRPLCEWLLLLHTQEVAGSSPAAPTI